eukprot:Nitzschia sp. Nitz4//scaffold5_size260463//69543//70331//NITZ4_000960-RA/size260463-processed-gene-0.120-mRNA-1//-1//CDS//3329555274//7680//frame0
MYFFRNDNSSRKMKHLPVVCTHPLADERTETSASPIEVLQEAQSLASEDAPLEAQPLYLHALSSLEQKHGYYSDEVALVFHLLAWFHYNLGDHSHALAYFLQSLRISCQLHGEDAPCTQAILDDMDDLLDDTSMEPEVVEQVFQSWVHQAHAIKLASSSRIDKNNDKTIQDCYLKALNCLPESFELERSLIYVALADLARCRRKTEEALSWYCKALLVLPQYLSKEHPRVLSVQKRSREVARQLTPMIPSRRQGSWARAASE